MMMIMIIIMVMIIMIMVMIMIAIQIYSMFVGFEVLVVAKLYSIGLQLFIMIISY